MSKTKHIIQNRTKVLNHYLKQIENNKPLTIEQEQALGRRIIAGDTEARNELIEANLRFVLSCALEMENAYVPIEELIAAGNYGLTIAASRYNPSYNNHFCSYAVHHIRKSIKEAIRTWTGLVDMPGLLQGLEACLSLDDRHDKDEDNWSRDLIDRIPAPPMISEVRRNFEEAKDYLHTFLSKWYYPSDVELLMDLAQMMYDGYTISDLAQKHGLPLKKIKQIISDLQQKAIIHQLQAAYGKAA